MPRSRRPFETQREGAWVNGWHHLIRRIDLCITRMEEHVGAMSLCEGDIRVNGARIGGEICWGGELRRIHVNRNDDRCALRARCADQRGVTGVECPHRGDEADRSWCRT